VYPLGGRGDSEVGGGTTMICPHCGAIMGQRYTDHYLTWPPKTGYVWHCRRCFTEMPGGVETCQDYDDWQIVGGDLPLEAGAVVR
jgi:hypothetical protein